jgi:steroid 5-alpha reductase family enzyme
MPGAGNLERRILLLSFGVLLFARMTLTLFVLLKRRFPWNELGGVAFALFVYHVGFASLGAGETAQLGILDLVAIGLFLFGSYLNTGSEIQRKRFKADPKNRGRLYTGGLFRFARHINYFGDTLWVSGWAIATRNIGSAVIPIALAAGFVFAFIPSLTKHLRASYGDQFDLWSKRTKAFIPYIY